MVEGVGAWRAYPRRRIDAAGGSAGSLRGIWTMAEGNGARSACSRRRNCALPEGNRARSAGYRRRYYAVRICNRRRRNPWALDRDNYRCVARKTGDRYTGTIQNVRRCSRQCWRRTGRVCRTAVFAGAKGTWLAKTVHNTHTFFSRARQGGYVKTK